jgi:4-amino-4-deoxy-L-arabinose transferase-like glycosyltransferase
LSEGTGLKETQSMPASARRSKLSVLLPVALTALVYLGSAGHRAIIDYDEGYYVRVAQEMSLRGDWVTPYANGVRFLEKPPLMYWVTAASFRILGYTEFAARLPTAIAVIALVWVVVLMARRAAGERAAVIAGLCLSCCVGTFLFTREALHDIWLVLFITLSMHAFLGWRLDPGHSRARALLFYAAMAGAAMTKSLVGIAFPAGIVVLFFLLARERPKLRDLHLMAGLSFFLLLTVPWHWLAAVRNEGFLWSFFANEQFLRFLGRHDPPIVWSVSLTTFWALIPVWFFPWTAFLPAAYVAGRRPAAPSERALVLLVLAWLAIILGFYTVSGRLEHYAFPVLPALALLVGLALSRNEGSRAVSRAFRGLAFFGAAFLAVGLLAGAWLIAGGNQVPAAGRSDMISQTDFSILGEMPAEVRQNLVAPALWTVAALAFTFPAALWYESRGKRMQAIGAVVAAMVLVCGMIHWSLILCEDMISSKKFALALARESVPGDRIVVVGDLESANSISFYQPLPVQVFDGVANSLIPGLKYKDAPKVVLSRAEFDAIWQSQGRAFALGSRDRISGLNIQGRESLNVLDRVLIRNH